MEENDQKTRSQDKALWRYGIIAPLLHRQEGEISQTALLGQLTTMAWRRPDQTQVMLSPETLRKWLYRYRQGGLAGLADQARQDKGRFQISKNLAEGLRAQRQAHPRWTTRLLLEEMIRQNLWNGFKPSRSTLYRYVQAHNLKRDPHHQSPPARAFAYDSFGQLWLADFLHGPKLRVGRHKRKTYLHVVLDDSSRYVVQGSFFFSEGVETLISELEVAVRRFGLPQRFYVDNGAAYRSRYLQIVCARLGIQLVHTPPYVPRGRGKVERFFRTMRDQFLAKARYPNLEHLNTAFQEWLDTYHRSKHSSLSCSPLNQRLASADRTRKLPEVAKTEALFRMERRCRVYADRTVRLKRRRYEVPTCLPNSRVTIYFLPWDLTHVYYGDDLEPARLLDTLANARRFDHPK